MLWIISAVAVAGIAAAGVFAALWWVQWRKTQLCYEVINRKGSALNDAYNDCDHWKHEACVHLEQERAAVEQAKLFERVGKTMEEHVTAERSRADRLAAALRESEDKREQLGAKLESAENALIEYEEGIAKANDEIKHLKTELDKMRRRGNSPSFTTAISAREIENVLNYNGTEEGQVDLKNG